MNHAEQRTATVTKDEVAVALDTGRRRSAKVAGDPERQRVIELG